MIDLMAVTRKESRTRRVCDQGTPKADITTLHAQYGSRIYRFCFRLCGRADDAEDLAQDVFVAACQGAEHFRGRSSVATWLYRIALTQWHNRQRRRGPPSASWDDMGEVAAPGADPAQTVPEDLALTHALAALPDDLRESFLLVRAEGLKYREAAQALNVPQGTVQWRVHEAARRLRVLLQEEDHHEL